MLFEMVAILFWPQCVNKSSPNFSLRQSRDGIPILLPPPESLRVSELNFNSTSLEESVLRRRVSYNISLHQWHLELQEDILCDRIVVVKFMWI